MTATISPVSRTAGDRAASDHLLDNITALRRGQTALAGRLPAMPEGPFVFGRDGYLTVRAERRWLDGCSVPLAAARRMLKDACVTGTTACLALATHGAHVRAAMERLSATQALIVIVEEERCLTTMLCCDDFSGEIGDERLFFAVGADWAEELERILADRTGLPTPTQFLRLPVTEEADLQAAVAVAQPIFERENLRRADRLASRRNRPRVGGSGRICVHAPSHFRLWNDGGHMLRTVAAEAFGDRMVHCDPDRPTRASAPALADAAEGCDAILALNLGRDSAPAVADLSVAWITYSTQGRIPAPVAGAGRDRLILADPDWAGAARAAGWVEGTVAVGGLPAVTTAAAPGDGAVAIIADVMNLDPPADVVELSSQRLLWEAIAGELMDDPFALPADTGRFLNQRMAKLGVSAESVDVSRWIGGLVVPAYQIGLARWLVGAQVPLAIYGKGWEGRGEWAACARGAIEGREALAAAVAGSAAVVHAWPTWTNHPVATCGRLAIGATHRNADSFLRQAIEAMKRGSGGLNGKFPTFSAELLVSVVE